MLLPTLITVLILAGTALFIHFYHVRTRHFGTEGRKQVTSVRWYEIVDWYLKVSSVVITIAAIHWQHPALLPFHDQMPLRLIGLVLSGVAIGLFVWAMSNLDVHYTPAHQSHLPLKLVSSGPYRFIRHPVYTSNLILLLGLLLVSGSYWLLVNLVILIMYYVPTILVEEKSLKGEFPEYREYAKQTGRFVPRLVRRNQATDEAAE